jgi:hypothetical protein
VELIVAVHANILRPTGPRLATEPPRYRRVATAPRPALVPNIARLCGFPGREAGFGARGFCRSHIQGFSFPPLECRHCRFPAQTQSDIVECHDGRPQSEVFEGACDSMGSISDVARGAFLCRAHFGDDAWPANGRTRADKWNCGPAFDLPIPWATLLSSARTGAAYSPLSERTTASPTLANTEPASAVLRRARGW